MPRNYGWGSRQAEKALWFALTDAVGRKAISYRTRSLLAREGEQFLSWVKAQYGIKRLDRIQREHAEAYAQHLAELVRANKLAESTAKTKISAINSCMTIASRGEWSSITPSKWFHRSTVRTRPTPTREQVERAIEQLSEPLHKAIARVCYELGLRAEEAAKLNARAALRQAQAKGSITIGQRQQAGRGTKNGRVRTIPVNQRGLQALAEASRIQPKGSRSMIPKDMSYKQFAQTTLRAVREGLKRAGIARLHDLRAAYAAERYREITGHKAPCNQGGRRTAPRAIDHAARMQISAELGHGRKDVVGHYIGTAR